MRDFMYDRLSKDDPIIALVEDRVWSPGVAGRFSPDNISKPFIVIRAGLRSRPMPSDSKVYQQPFLIWAHDEPGTMDNIDAIMDAVAARLDVAAPAWWNESYIMECRHEGDSDDLFDDGFGTNTRFATWRLTFRK